MVRRHIRRGVVALAAPVLATVAGCIGNGGTEIHNAPSLGQELIDLKTARDVGAINDNEYHDAKSGLLHSRPAAARAEGY